MLLLTARSKRKFFLESSGIRLLKQPPYSPDFNLHDRFTFRNFESFRRKINFSNSEQLKNHLMQFLTDLSISTMNQQFDHLLDHMKQVIICNGNYV